MKKIIKKREKLSRKNILIYILLAIFCLYGIMFLYHSSKPLPKGVSFEGEIYEVDEDNVEFLYDITYRDEYDNEIIEQKIFDKVLETIDNAEEFIFLDFFLWDSGEDVHRDLSTELVNHLIEKKKENPEIKINFMTDSYNTFYGSKRHEGFDKLEENGIEVGFTDLDKLRDSNPIYSAAWRIFFKPFGVPEKCEKSLIKLGGEKRCIRSALKALNFKANHRKVLVADNYINGSKKVVSIVTSANPSSHGSKYSNVALYIEDEIWKDIYYSEKAVADFSKEDFVEHDFDIDNVNIEDSATVQFLTEGKIKKNFVDEIDKTVEGESIDIAQFLLTERDVVDSLIKASKRGVEVRLVLDPSYYLFGKDSKGIPNRLAARDLVNEGNGKIDVRWYDTHGEEFHSKVMVIKKKNGWTIVFLGSANLTRRNIDDYNLEADVKLVAQSDSKVVQDIYAFFERIYNNENGHYTLDYEEKKDNSKWKYFKYRFQEATGISVW